MKAAVLLCLAVLPCLLDARLVLEGEDGFGECNDYFYQGSPPQGFSEPSYVKICQKYNGDKQFATLYSTRDKIPVYSAFTYRDGDSSAGGSWLVEPQLDDAGSSLDEATNANDISEQIGSLGANQALEEDYSSSDYQPGPLFHNAPNALTNAVPLTPSFKEKWASNVQKLIKGGVLPYCANGDNLHLIAGAIPSSVKVNDKVSVPEFVWLAACCNIPEAWSMGIIKRTADLDGFEDVSVEELENKFLGGVKLFSNQCGGGNTHPEQRKLSESLSHTEAEPEAKTSGPFFRFIQFLVCIVYEIVKSILYLVWFLVKQICNLIFGRLYWIWTAVTTYIFALSEVLLNIPCDVLRVCANILCGFVRIINNLLSIVCLILRLPLRFLTDMASFPYYTVCAIPDVGIDILSGIWGVIALGFRGIFGAFGGSFSVASFAGSSFLQRFIGQSEGFED
ncbi:endonuclease domain-containing 1 protein [Rhinophrynus dorsalis]